MSRGPTAATCAPFLGPLEKPHEKSIRVAIRPSNIYAFKQQKFTFLQLSDFSNLRFELKSNVLFV